MKLNELQNIPGSRKKSKRLGRGIGSGKGKTSGRGVKGQKARAGVSINGFEGGQMPLIARLPKRGFNSLNHKTFSPLNFFDIERLVESKKIKEGDLIDKDLLKKVGVIKNTNVKVKLLAFGELKAKFKFSLDAYSKAAKDSVVKAGGEIK
jgi:large subunit ribosomal protein L15